MLPPFHRQDAKSAKNFAKQNSLQMSVFSHLAPMTSLCAIQDKPYWLGCAPARRHSQLDCDTVQKPKRYDVRNTMELYGILAAGWPCAEPLLRGLLHLKSGDTMIR